jgi:UDP-N-acetylglucosamine 1-carboxyvinyltransferase
MLEADTALIQQSELISGNVSVSGYKHAAVLVLCATICAPEVNFTLHNIPQIEDTIVLADIIRSLGGEAKFTGKNTLQLNTTHLKSHQVPVEFSKLIHGAVYLIPSLLAKQGRIEIGECGGCQIGDNTIIGKRPIFHMLKVLEQFGCTFKFENNLIIGTKTADFTASTIDIKDFSDSKEIITGPNVSGATKTAILAAMAVRQGKTIIKNPYLKADVFELLNFIKLLGYQVEYNQQEIVIEGQYTKQDADYWLCSDISEIMTYITIACYHQINLTINNIQIEKIKLYLLAEFQYLEKMGIFCVFANESIVVSPPIKINPIEIEVVSLGIYSDHQPFFALLLFNADQPSSIVERVWHSRFDYAKELSKLGFKSEISNNTLKVMPSTASNSDQLLNARDLRAAAVLLIAALKTPGASHITGLSHLKRGYEGLVENLRNLNGKIVFKQQESQETGVTN